MTSSRKTSTELSAYLDGEARHPERIAGRIADDNHAAGRVSAYRQMGDRIRALPRMEPSAGFARRVVNRIEAEAQTPERPRRRIALAPMAAVAAVVVIAGLAAVTVYRTPDTPAPAANGVETPTTLAANSDGSGESPAQNESPVTTSIVSPEYLAGPTSVELSTDELLLALAGSEWFDSFAEEWEDDRDYEAALSELEGRSASIFVQLLTESARSEILGSEPQEG